MRRSNEASPERLKLTCSRADAQRRLLIQVDRGNELLPRVTSVRDEAALDSVEAEYETWYEFNCRLLKQIGTTEELFDAYPPSGPQVLTTADLQFAKMVQNLATSLKGCIRSLESISDQLDLVDEIEKPSAPAPSPTTASPHVFIIHGHDYQAAIELKELIDECFPSLTPVLLAREAWRGRTVIEKFEEEASKCGFAFAVFTPDDNVQAGHDEYQQMRPNVVFELGWFYGKIGRRRTCILYKQGTQIPSDLAGLGWHGFDTSVKQAYYEIEKELRAAFGDRLK